MPRVLLVAYYFPPVAASGSMRPLGFCRYLQAHGWIPHVLTTDSASSYPWHPIDHELMSRVPTGMDLDIVPYVDPLHRLIRLRNAVNTFVKNGVGSKPAHGSTPVCTNRAVASVISSRWAIAKETLLESLFAFPDPQAAWEMPAILRGAALKGEKRPNVVLATGGPWTSLLVGRGIAQRLSVPLVIDYRDPWTSNPFGGFSAEILNRRAKRLEASLLHEAAAIIANTEELGERLAVDYPLSKEKLVVIPNGFDRDAIGGRSTEADSLSQAQRQDRHTLELCHFGTLYLKRTPRALLQALRRVSDQTREGDIVLKLRFVGAWEVQDQECEKLAVDLEKQGVLRRDPPVGNQICLQQMARADGLLIIQPDSPMQIPAKLYEYVGAERPLVLIGGEGATARLVRRHHLGLVCPNDVENVTKLLLQLRAKPELLQPPISESAGKFDYRGISANVAKLLSKILERGCIR